MDFRADLYAANGRFQRTERYTADSRDAATDTARRLLVAHGLDNAVVYVVNGTGQAMRIAHVGVTR